MLGVNGLQFIIIDLLHKSCKTTESSSTSIFFLFFFSRQKCCFFQFTLFPIWPLSVFKFRIRKSELVRRGRCTDYLPWQRLNRPGSDVLFCTVPSIILDCVRFSQNVPFFLTVKPECVCNFIDRKTLVINNNHLVCVYTG